MKLLSRVQWSHWLPFLAWRTRLDRQGLGRDALAGLAGALTLIPVALACAVVAGLPPEYGLYAAVVPVLVAALWGSSWHLAGGPGVLTGLVIFSAITPLAALVANPYTSGGGYGGYGGYGFGSGFGSTAASVLSGPALPAATPEYIRMVLLLTLLVGLAQLLIGLLRRGTLVNFVSQGVLTGFAAGVALLVAVASLRHVFGLNIERSYSAWRAFTSVLRSFTDINTFMLATAVLVLVVVVAQRRWLPRWPGFAFALVLGSLFVYGVNRYYGMDRTGLRVLDTVPFTWPPFAKPDLTWKSFGQLAPIAIALALLGLALAARAARAVTGTTGQRVDLNREAVGQGLGNAVGGLFSGFVSTPAPRRTQMNVALGASTPLAAVFAALLVCGIAWGCARDANFVPVPVLGALILILAWELIDFKGMLALWRAGRGQRQEFVACMVTLFATQTVDLVYALYIGLGLSLLLAVERATRVRLVEVKPVPGMEPVRFLARADAPDCPQLKMLAPEGTLGEATLDALVAQFEALAAANPGQRHVLLAGTAIEQIDAPVAAWLAGEAQRRRAGGGGLYLHDLREPVLAVLRETGAIDAIGAEQIFGGEVDPIAAVFKRLNPGQCVPCQARIFEGICPKPVEITWSRPPGDKTKGRYAVPPTAWARPATKAAG